VIKYVSAAPVHEVMTAEELRPYLRIDDETAEETGVINRLIAAARSQVEHDTGLLLRPQAWVVSRMYWPREPYLVLPAVPVRAVESLAYTTAGGTIVLEPDALTLEGYEDRYARVALTGGAAWPGSRLVLPGLVCRFECGYAACPEDLLEAVRALVAYWYDNREAAIASTAYKADVSVLPLRYQDLVTARRVWRR
jgi:uncharacterized phiE125 gp8 family phage protein